MDTKEDNVNWNVLDMFFPPGWEDKAVELGALVRQRKLKTAEELLRLLLIHLGDGCSMRETVVRCNFKEPGDGALECGNVDGFVVLYGGMRREQVTYRLSRCLSSFHKPGL